MNDVAHSGRVAAEDLRRRIQALAPDGLDLIFREARTYRAWQDRAVDDALLHRLFEMTRLGPTSGNCCPGRFVFVRSAAA